MAKITSYFFHHVINLPKGAEILSVYEKDGRFKIDVIEDGSAYGMRFFTVCNTPVAPAGARLVGVVVLSDGSRYIFEVPHASQTGLGSSVCSRART